MQQRIKIAVMIGINAVAKNIIAGAFTNKDVLAMSISFFTVSLFCYFYMLALSSKPEANTAASPIVVIKAHKIIITLAASDLCLKELLLYFLL